MGSLPQPLSWHGVTTIVMGNCGVGFAPVEPGKQEFLIGLMEGVEDIPGETLAKGINWQWESFAQYLDALSAMRRAIDVGAQCRMGAVRAYVMGVRGAHNEPATEEDIARMAALVRDALRAGALGFQHLAYDRASRRRTANWCPAPTPLRMNFWASAALWVRSAMACLKWRPI